MAQVIIEEGKARFQSDSQLLEELGERLVASPAIAVSELIKNSFDADAEFCHVWFDHRNEPTLSIADNGHGITKVEFLSNWMTIATQFKRIERTSRNYKRAFTGSKGVGRFATRFLGQRLELVTYAFDEAHDAYGKLTATFDWPSFKAGKDLREIEIPYTYEIGVQPPKLSTTLTITKLRQQWTDDIETTVRRQVLGICSPFPVLESGTVLRKAVSKDPGFDVFFSRPGVKPKTQDTVATEVLDHHLAKVTISVEDCNVGYVIRFRGSKLEKRFKHRIKENLIGPLHTDIRFLPWFRGQYTGFKHITGSQAREWVKENSGVKVFDHGFQVPPYGEKDDDWLRLSADRAQNIRQWRSGVANRYFPKEDQPTTETRDPFLMIPANHQLVGAVFLSTPQVPTDKKPADATRRLQVAMDRQGYVNNEGLSQLVDLVRGGLDLLAVAYREYDIAQKERAAREESDRVKKGIKETITAIAQSNIPPPERKKLVRKFEKLQREVSSLDAAHVKARESIELLGLLGGLAGFLTHETETMFKAVDQLLTRLREQKNRLKELGLTELIDKADQARQQLKDQLEYAHTFVSGIKIGKPSEFPAKVQIDRIIDKMKSFTDPRGIDTENKVRNSLQAGPTLPTVYSGILMNLYTNAIKAILAAGPKNTKKTIRFEAENDKEWHMVRVNDTGIGVPEGLEKRIFDPFFSTTTESPLGPGMGLGLSIVRRLAEDLGGSISLVKPAKGFSTCFELRLRRK